MYVLLIGQQERQVLAAQTATAALRAGGADVAVPSLEDARAEFDAALIAPPRPKSERERQLADLGVA